MTDEWRPVVGYEGLYSVSNTGLVRSEPRIARHFTGAPSRRQGKELKLLPDGRGYLQVGLSRDGKVCITKVAHMVAAAFIGPRPIGQEVCHNDGNSRNNAVGNLRYGTPLSNAADRRLHGTQAFGEVNSTAKLTEAQALEILHSTEPQQVLADRFGVTQPSISMIKTGARWQHLKEIRA